MADVIPSNDGPLSTFRRVLVVAAHPDDVESHCGGALRRLVDADAEVRLVLVTSGDKGSSSLSDPTEVAALREAEQLAAARLLGVTEVIFLRWLDGEINDLPGLRRQLTLHIRQHRPDLVITHDGEHPWPAYTAHRDHRAVGRTTVEALYPDARDRLYYPEQLTEGLTPHETPEAWLIMSQAPDLIVDISSTIGTKIDARLAHSSQHGDAAELEQRFRARAAELGEPHGLAYAEAFKQIRFR